MSETQEQELARLRAENTALKAGGGERPRLKVSEKGGVSVYGLGRFPVTLYLEQWRALLGMKEEIEQFIQDNACKLKTKAA